MSIDTRPGMRRPGGRTSRTRESVLTATLALLTDDTEPLTIARVAERSGVHASSIYRRWGSVGSLLLDAAVDRGDSVVPVPDLGSLTADLHATLREIADFLSSPVGAALLRLAASDQPEATPLAQGYRETRLPQFTVLIERAQERGEIRDDVLPELAMELAAAPVHQRILLTRLPVDDAFLNAIVTTFARAWHR